MYDGPQIDKNAYELGRWASVMRHSSARAVKTGRDHLPTNRTTATLVPNQVLASEESEFLFQSRGKQAIGARCCVYVVSGKETGMKGLFHAIAEVE
jgi:hypothetical protein